VLLTAHPVLPSRSISATIDFYRQLGFTVYHRFGEEYAILKRDGAELHFFGFPDVDAATSVFSIYVRVRSADQLHAAFRDQGVAMLSAPESKPWGQREFALVDPDGTLLRFAETLPKPVNASSNTAHS
jgi:catechol 2,3-dioxygenase-like lactoylglutathione lyase family enzyme